MKSNYCIDCSSTMADYNIIYTSTDNKPYLWNGSSFDLLSKKENEKLRFSGKSYTDKEIAEAAEKPGKQQKVNFRKIKIPGSTRYKFR